MKLRSQRIAARSQRSLIMARILAGAATLALCAGQALAKPAESAPAADETAIAYFLPKLEAEVTGSFRLVKCDENLSRLRLGKGGLFGSREAAAKFDAMGMPSELSYGSKSGADAIAGVLDTGRDGIKALGNSELAQLQAEIALEEARQKLEALRAAGDTTGN